MPTASDPQLIVIGSGAAGLMAACVAAPSCAVLLVTDRGLGTSNSAVAQGGLQLPTEDPESTRSFIRDIERSAGEPLDPRRLAAFVDGVRPTVDLLCEWGLELDRHPDGRLRRSLAGGLSEPRIVSTGDQIGPSVLSVLRRRADQLGIDIRTRSRVDDIRRDIGGSAVGFTLEMHGDRPLTCAALVVCAGGGTYETARDRGVPTSNPANANTRLYGSIRRLGVPFLDDESFQYQPYGVVDDERGVTGRCVPESVVELGARVVDADGHPVAPPGSDRRALTTAMFDALSAGRGERSGSTDALRLTLGHIPSETLRERYPKLGRILDQSALPDGDLHVVPVLHYQLGGFEIAPDGATVVPGLFLAGEITGGLHGRNRLMGNGITEALVEGRAAGIAAAEFVGQLP